jgi:hypothetical protein
MFLPSDTPTNLRLLTAYWAGLADGATPYRAQIDPAAIKSLLPYLMIVEFEDDPFRVRFRLAGTEVDAVTGIHLTNRYLDELWTPETAAAIDCINACYRDCRRTGQPVISTYHWPDIDGHFVTVRFGVFPLKIDDAIRQCLAMECFPEAPDPTGQPVWIDPLKDG